jgi:signal transduction histidine kinase
MFSSLRSRLGLSYALLIGVMLILTAAVLVISLLRNPQVYQSALPLLRQVAQDVLPRAKQAAQVSTQRLDALLTRETQGRKLRIAVIDSSGKVVADSGRLLEGLLPVLDPARLDELKSGSRPALLRDRRGRLWVYTVEDFEGGSYLLVAERVVNVPVMNLLRNEVVAPLLVAGGIAFLVALLLSVWMGRWISEPLGRMVDASHGLASGKDVVVPEQGPDEVKELARSLNAMHRQVTQSQQSQRDFVANVSHELKTPLTSIQGFAQAILDGAVQTPQALRQAAEVIFNESNRMHRLVLDLLTLARLESGTADLQNAPVDLSALLRAAVVKFSPQAQQAQVNLTCEFPELPTMTGDGDRLSQVFTNLVDNALKFTPPGGKVQVKAFARDGWAQIEVSDSGKGIPPEDRERIFERFFQMDKSRRKGADRGAGLGLPIARQIVLAHGGKIWADSQPGQGARLIVQLPLRRVSPFPEGRGTGGWE